MDYAVVADIGGTSIKYGLVSRDGDIVFKDKCDSEAQKGASHLMDIVKAAVGNLLAHHGELAVKGIGIATAGQIDLVNGRVLFATPNIPNYTGTDIKGIIEAEFGLKTFVENDVNAATVGEVWKGAGAGAEKVLCITMGTGIGGCIMFGGKVEHGIFGSAGEVGHIIIEYGWLQCNCGNRGCFEQYASASALVRNYTGRLAKGDKSLTADILESTGEIDARVIFNAARKGDRLANEVMDEFVSYLGTGLISLIHVLNPELVIIGGGISNEGEYLSGKVDEYVKGRAMPSFLRKLRLTTARLGNDAGIVGAAKIAFDGLNS